MTVSALRLASPGDAPAIAALHAACWHQAYGGLLPRAMLDAVSVERQTFMWARIVSRPGCHHDERVHLALEDGALVGFVACGAQRTPALRDAGFEGEVAALYVRARSQRRGVGSALMRMAAEDLSSRRFCGLALWVLRDNAPARRFYDALGGAPSSPRPRTASDAQRGGLRLARPRRPARPFARRPLPARRRPGPSAREK